MKKPLYCPENCYGEEITKISDVLKEDEVACVLLRVVSQVIPVLFLVLYRLSSVCYVPAKNTKVYMYVSSTIPYIHPGHCPLPLCKNVCTENQYCMLSNTTCDV